MFTSVIIITTLPSLDINIFLKISAIQGPYQRESGLVDGRTKTALFQGSHSTVTLGKHAHPNYILIQDVGLDYKI